MTLRASLLRTLENINLSVDNRVELCCEATRELENRGKYEEAQRVLREYWPRAGEPPKLAGLEETTAAELLLDETRACVFLAEGRLSEAERKVLSALRVQEQHGNVYLITEALITYGRVLARSKRYSAALGTFRLAIELADSVTFRELRIV